MTDMPHPRTLALLERLIGFETISAASNLELIDFAQGLLDAAGFRTTRLTDPCGTKAGLMARLGPDGSGGVMLSAHSDVVPVVGQDWTRPPFQLTRDGGRLFGRGTTDMKVYLAAMLSAAERAASQPLRQPLMLSISYDEEVGCTGIRQMLPGIAALGWQPELCIVGEPTSMRPAIGHKGKVAFLATCRGQAGHSALAPLYVNALHLACDLVSALRAMQQEYVSAGAQDAAYDVPYSTVHVARIVGGTTLNIVPHIATVEFELRHLPAETVADFLQNLQQRIDAFLPGYVAQDPGASIEIATAFSYPGLQISPDHPAVTRVAALCPNPATTKVAYGTEAGYFTQLGIPTVVCGPGDMTDQGHKADESLTLAQLSQCDLMMDRLLAGM